ncbi:hypothetical protein [Psychroserpens ponticola]|uniref:Uncharacterized protein n=1 Tax=Psychroserpens ponticola TaxID=2932268 RepID=A0ABY7RWC0_9FLAO|nr:hypothetical protein [Psychroserpens ponticola]WCO01138.1 hypothetical protein MUN68_013825 [Psychroserpens ponticola]
MDKHHVIKSVKVNEIERKFIIQDFNKEETWDREFIIFQWFVAGSDNIETKLKLIIDLHSLNRKYVRVTKERLSNEAAKKTVDYLDSKAINYSELIGTPFVCKRRSIKKDIHLDKFIYSNGICKFLLEDEGNHEDLENFCKENDIKVVEDVTDQVSYRNINMTIDFLDEHLSKLKFLQTIV